MPKGDTERLLDILAAKLAIIDRSCESAARSQIDRLLGQVRYQGTGLVPPSLTEAGSIWIRLVRDKAEAFRAEIGRVLEASKDRVPGIEALPLVKAIVDPYFEEAPYAHRLSVFVEALVRQALAHGAHFDPNSHRTDLATTGYLVGLRDALQDARVTLHSELQLHFSAVPQKSIVGRIKDHWVVVSIVTTATVLAFTAGVVSNTKSLYELGERFLMSDEERFTARVALASEVMLADAWEERCGFQLPKGWQLRQDPLYAAADVVPASGSVLDQAGFKLEIAAVEGMVGEIRFYEREYKEGRAKDRGFILTFADQKEAVPEYKREEQFVRSQPLRFRVMYEDGVSTITEAADIMKDSAGRIIVEARLLPTDGSARQTDKFPGYNEFRCSADAKAGQESTVTLCTAILERTLMQRPLGYPAVACEKRSP